MIYLTGDLHGDPSRLEEKYFPESHQLGDDDYIIQLGDFGCLWSNSKNDPNEKANLDFFASRNYTTVFVDGNHENFPRIYEYPIVDFCGGKAHKINDRLYHLIRGNIYEFNGYKFFAFGGALSIDKQYRLPGVSWWPEEYPTTEEMQFGIDNLEKVNYEVDYIITHAAPTSIVQHMNEKYLLPDSYESREHFNSKLNDSVSRYLEYILEKTKFKYWFFGHYHINFKLMDKFFALYVKKLNLNKAGDDDWWR